MNKKKVFIGYVNIANFITILGLIFALVSIGFAFSDHLNFTMIFLILAGVCDLFDGMVARKIDRTESEKEFGIQLDTVADVVSFGVAPIAIAFAIVSREWYALIVYVFYLICAVTRLAYFNTIAEPGVPTKHYQGLPVTFISLSLPAIMFIPFSWLIVLAFAVIAILFILNVKIPKPRGVWYYIFPVIALSLIVLWCVS